MSDQNPNAEVAAKRRTFHRLKDTSKTKPEKIIAVKCTRCGGSGIFHTFGACYRCGGNGWDPKERTYAYPHNWTSRDIDKWNEQREAKNQERREKQAERRDLQADVDRETIKTLKETIASPDDLSRALRIAASQERVKMDETAPASDAQLGYVQKLVIELQALIPALKNWRLEADCLTKVSASHLISALQQRIREEQDRQNTYPGEDTYPLPDAKYEVQDENHEAAPTERQMKAIANISRSLGLRQAPVPRNRGEASHFIIELQKMLREKKQIEKANTEDEGRPASRIGGVRTADLMMAGTGRPRTR